MAQNQPIQIQSPADRSWITPAILVGAGLFFYNKIFGKSESEKGAEREESKIDTQDLKKNPFAENFTPSKPKKSLRPGEYYYRRKTAPALMNKSAQEIKKAIGIFTDDETAIVNAFKRAITKTEVNLIGRNYSAMYKRDLMFDLKDNLNAKELLPIFSYINKLPDTTFLQ